MFSGWEIVAAACTGAAVQEVVYWYGQREIVAGIKQPQGSTPRPATDESADGSSVNWLSYWLITGAMIVGAGLGSYFWYADRIESTELRDALITGAAFPTLLKIAVQSSLKANKPVSRLGTGTNAVAAYFGGRR